MPSVYPVGVVKLRASADMKPPPFPLHPRFPEKLQPDFGEESPGLLPFSDNMFIKCDLFR